MHPDKGRLYAVRKAHAPRKSGWDPITAIPGEKAADAPDSVSNGRRRSSQIEGPKAANAGPQALKDQRRNSEYKAAKPGKSSRIPKYTPALLTEFEGGIDDVPELGPDNASNHNDSNHPDRIGVDAGPTEASVHDKSRNHGCHPKHQPEGRHTQPPDVNVRQHIPSSIDALASSAEYLCLSSRSSGRDFHRHLQLISRDSRDTVCMATTTYQGLEVLYTRQQIAERVQEMGAQITRDLNGEKLVMVGVLKGAAPFLADLARAVQADATFDFVAVSSYGNGQRSSGAVKLIKDLDEPIEGKNVLVVEDILDTGLTLSYLRKLLLQQHPKSLRIATLLDKPSRRLEKIEADYVGFAIPNLFVIGYGMDYAERYRNLPDICLMTPEHPE